MSGTTDGTQRITIISKKSAVNDRANICPFIRLGELSGMVFSDYVKNGLRTEDRNDQLALGCRSSTRALPTRTGGRSQIATINSLTGWPGSAMPDRKSV